MYKFRILSAYPYLVQKQLSAESVFADVEECDVGICSACYIYKMQETFWNPPTPQRNTFGKKWMSLSFYNYLVVGHWTAYDNVVTIGFSLHLSFTLMAAVLYGCNYVFILNFRVSY